jgi:hypothetical protein
VIAGYTKDVTVDMLAQLAASMRHGSK